VSSAVDVLVGQRSWVWDADEDGLKGRRKKKGKKDHANEERTKR